MTKSEDQYLIHFFVDASVSSGSGHLSRCFTISRALKNKTKSKVKFFVPHDSDIQSMINNCQEFELIDPNQNVFSDAIIKNTDKNAILVIDNYRITEDDLFVLYKEGYRIVVIEDGCRLSNYPVNLVIDSSPLAAEKPYSGRKETKFCLGPKYFPLKEEFRSKGYQNKSFRKSVKILITFGGIDEQDMTSRVLDILSSVDEKLNLTVVLGPFYSGSLSISSNSQNDISVFRNPDNYFEILSAADMAISGAGATALELAYLGVPSILIPLSPDQESVARGLTELGAAIIINPNKPAFGLEIHKTVLRLIREENKRTMMSKVGRDIVDGFGGSRVAEEIIAASR